MDGRPTRSYTNRTENMDFGQQMYKNQSHEYARAAYQSSLPNRFGVPVNQSPLSGSKKNQISNKKFMDSLPSDEDAGLIFQMDGFEESLDEPLADDEDDNAFEQSDESPANSCDEAPIRSFKYATSVPISVPRWLPENHTKDDDDEPRIQVQNIERLAESFQLFRNNSVVDGTELFGDRPCRRYCTGDLIKSRPL
ncbi:hypothetical protein HDE_00099 [Halotydeus destructor]|nr:hypothetical protein HDE_00099 [Halotydeus destructor]